MAVLFERSTRPCSSTTYERGRLRKHVNCFVNDHPVQDRVALSDAVAPDDEVYVFQALSGG